MEAEGAFGNAFYLVIAAFEHACMNRVIAMVEDTVAVIGEHIGKLVDSGVWKGIRQLTPHVTFCCNFKTFQYLYEHAQGNLLLLSRSVKEMSRLYCVARLIPVSFTSPEQIESESQLEFELQVQTDALPPLNKINQNLSSVLVQKEIETLPHFPENWEQRLQDGERPEDYHIYPFE
jgi:hypothetical protein